MSVGPTLSPLFLHLWSDVAIIESAEKILLWNCPCIGNTERSIGATTSSAPGEEWCSFQQGNPLFVCASMRSKLQMVNSPSHDDRIELSRNSKPHSNSFVSMAPEGSTGAANSRAESLVFAAGEVEYFKDFQDLEDDRSPSFPSRLRAKRGSTDHRRRSSSRHSPPIPIMSLVSPTGPQPSSTPSSPRETRRSRSRLHEPLRCAAQRGGKTDRLLNPTHPTSTQACKVIAAFFLKQAVHRLSEHLDRLKSLLLERDSIFNDADNATLVVKNGQEVIRLLQDVVCTWQQLQPLLHSTKMSDFLIVTSDPSPFSGSSSHVSSNNNGILEASVAFFPLLARLLGLVEDLYLVCARSTTEADCVEMGCASRLSAIFGGKAEHVERAREFLLCCEALQGSVSAADGGSVDPVQVEDSLMLLQCATPEVDLCILDTLFVQQSIVVKPTTSGTKVIIKQQADFEKMLLSVAAPLTFPPDALASSVLKMTCAPNCVHVCSFQCGSVFLPCIILIKDTNSRCSVFPNKSGRTSTAACARKESRGTRVFLDDKEDAYHSVPRDRRFGLHQRSGSVPSTDQRTLIGEGITGTEESRSASNALRGHSVTHPFFSSRDSFSDESIQETGCQEQGQPPSYQDLAFSLGVGTEEERAAPLPSDSHTLCPASHDCVGSPITAKEHLIGIHQNSSPLSIAIPISSKSFSIHSNHPSVHVPYLTEEEGPRSFDTQRPADWPKDLQQTSSLFTTKMCILSTHHGVDTTGKVSTVDCLELAHNNQSEYSYDAAATTLPFSSSHHSPKTLNSAIGTDFAFDARLPQTTRFPSVGTSPAYSSKTTFTVIPSSIGLNNADFLQSSTSDFGTTTTQGTMSQEPEPLKELTSSEATVSYRIRHRRNIQSDSSSDLDEGGPLNKNEGEVHTLRVKKLNACAEWLLGLGEGKDLSRLRFFAPVPGSGENHPHRQPIDAAVGSVEWYHAIHAAMHTLMPAEGADAAAVEAAVTWLLSHAGLCEVQVTGKNQEYTAVEGLPEVIQRCSLGPGSAVPIVVLDTVMGTFYGVDAFSWTEDKCENSIVEARIPLQRLGLLFRYVLSTMAPENTTAYLSSEQKLSTLNNSHFLSKKDGAQDARNNQAVAVKRNVEKPLLCAVEEGRAVQLCNTESENISEDTLTITDRFRLTNLDETKGMTKSVPMKKNRWTSRESQGKTDFPVSFRSVSPVPNAVRHLRYHSPQNRATPNVIVVPAPGTVEKEELLVKNSLPPSFTNDERCVSPSSFPTDPFGQHDVPFRESPDSVSSADFFRPASVEIENLGDVSERERLPSSGVAYQQSSVVGKYNNSVVNMTSFNTDSVLSASILQSRGNDIHEVRISALQQRLQQAHEDIVAESYCSPRLPEELLCNDILLLLVVQTVLQHIKNRNSANQDLVNVIVFINQCGTHLVLDIVPTDKVPLTDEKRQVYQESVRNFYVEREKEHQQLLPLPVPSLLMEKKEQNSAGLTWIDCVVQHIDAASHSPVTAASASFSPHNSSGVSEGSNNAATPLPDVWACKVGISPQENSLVHPKWYLSDQFRELLSGVKGAAVVTDSGSATIAFPFITQSKLDLLKELRIVQQPLMFLNDKGILAVNKLANEVLHMRRAKEEAQAMRPEIISLGYDRIALDFQQALKTKSVSLLPSEEICEAQSFESSSPSLNHDTDESWHHPTSQSIRQLLHHPTNSSIMSGDTAALAAELAKQQNLSALPYDERGRQPLGEAQNISSSKEVGAQAFPSSSLSPPRQCLFDGSHFNFVDVCAVTSTPGTNDIRTVDFPYCRMLVLHKTPCEGFIDWLTDLGHAVVAASSPKQISRILSCDISTYEVVFLEWTPEIMTPENVELLEQAKQRDFYTPVFHWMVGCSPQNHQSHCTNLSTLTTGFSHNSSSPPFSNDYPSRDTSNTHLLFGPTFHEAAMSERLKIRAQVRLGRILKDVRGDASLFFQVTSRIGSGGFGDVYEVSLYASKGRLAMKKLPLGTITLDRMEQLYKEVSIMRELDHRNIVQLSHVTCDRTHLNIFMELCQCSLLEILEVESSWFRSSQPSMEVRPSPRSSEMMTVQRSPSSSFQAFVKGEGSLPFKSNGISIQSLSNVSIFDTLSKKPFSGTEGNSSTRRFTATKTIPTVDMLLIIKDILNGLSYLHSYNIVHRDIKPQNILFLDGVAKLADFGSATTVSGTPDPLHTMKGTLPYMAPEVFLGEMYRKSCDIWSLGILFAEILGLHLAHFSLLHFPALQEFYRGLSPDDCMPVVATNYIHNSFKKHFPDEFIRAVQDTLRCAMETNKKELLEKRTRNKNSVSNVVSSFPVIQEARRTIYVIQVNAERLACTQKRHTLPASLIELLESTFHRCPDKRITGEQLLEHPIANDRDWLHRMFVEVRELNACIGTMKREEEEEAQCMSLSMSSKESFSGDDVL